jgi:fibronectin-binding autotransporter adhesin
MKRIALTVAGLLAAVAFAGLARADQNWDGDNPVGNFSYNNNWFGADVQPGWGYGGALHFTHRNDTNQTNLYNDYTNWVSTDAIFWDSTFGAGLTLDSAGQGIDFDTKIENNSPFAQVLNTPVSGAKNGAPRIELNPVDGDLTLRQTVFNDNNRPYEVWGHNARTLAIATNLVGDASVSLAIKEYSKVRFTAAQSFGSATNLAVEQGELLLDAGGSLAGGMGIALGLADTNTAKFYLAASNGGASNNQAITVNNAGGLKVIGSLNTNGTHTFSGPITLNGDVAIEPQSAGGTLKLSGVIGEMGGNRVLLKTGAGVLTLSSGASTYSGGTILSAGQTTLGASSAGFGNSVTNGPLGTGTVTLGGGTLQMNAKTLGNHLSVAAGTASIIDNGGGDGYLDGNWSGSGTLTLQNSSGGGLSLKTAFNASVDWSGFTGTLNYQAVNGQVFNVFMPTAVDLSHAVLISGGGGTPPGNWSSLRFGGGTNKVGALGGAFGYMECGGTLEVGSLSTNTTFGGTILSGSVIKVGTGTLTLTGANTYGGTTTVSNGTLLVSAAHTGAGAATVADGATLGVTAGSGQWKPASMTVGSSLGAALAFAGLNSTNTAPLATGTLSFNGSNTIQVAGEGLRVGRSYPLVTCTNLAVTGSYTLDAQPTGTTGHLAVAGSTIYYVVDTAPPAAVDTWTGAANATWAIGASANWTNSSGGNVYADGDVVRFDDAAMGDTAITIAAPVEPASVTVSNSAKAYSFAGSAIGGSGGLLKQGNGALTLSSANTYGGGTTIGNGTVSLGNSTAAGPGPITLAGGTLQNVGAADIGVANNIVVGSGGAIKLGTTRNLTVSGALSGAGDLTLALAGGPLSSLNVSFSANTAAGTITIPGSTGNNQTVTRFKTPTSGSAAVAWSIGGAQDRGTTLDFGTSTIEFGSLSGAGLIQGNGAGLKTLSVGGLNTNSTFTGRLVDNVGTLALTKVGSGTLTLTGANTYSGPTTVNGGTLALNALPTGHGAVSVLDGATLRVAAAGAAQYAPSALSVGSTNGAALTFAGVTSSNIAPLSTGTLTVNGSNVVNVLNGFFSAGQAYPLVAFTALTGTGSFALGAQPNLTAGHLSLSSNVLAYVVDDISADTWTGAASADWDLGVSANWTNVLGSLIYTDGDLVRFDDMSIGSKTVNVAAVVSPAGVTVSNSANSYVFGGNAIAGAAGLAKDGPGMLTLLNANTYSGVTTIRDGILQVGNGGTTGSMGSGAVVNDGVLRFNLNANVGVANNLSGPGALTVSGGNRLHFSGVHTHSGATTVNAGSVLEINAVAAVSSNSDYTVNGTLEAYSDGGAAYSMALGALSGSGHVYCTKGTGGASAAVLTLGATGVSGSYAGLIHDAVWGAAVTQGLTKIGGGTQVLTGTNTYSGPTTVSAGTLVVNSAQTGAGAATVADGATLGVSASGASQWQPAAVTVGSTAGAALRFTMSSTAVPPLATGALTFNGINAIHVAAGGGSLTKGQRYPLVSYTNLVVAGAYVLGGGPADAQGWLITQGNTIYFVPLPPGALLLVR